MACGPAPNLAWLVDDQGIEPHTPVFDKSARNGAARSMSGTDPVRSRRLA
ncbi:hypothetical protein K3174_14840 [Qipengyuania sp. 6D47A]|uniref:Transposase n=1 Tax=Qipengyuania qiaonensis TaxID=2867240 RepID=A0ABS7J908_9SPHN|nr:hypothetical protein [Qipengyuania qiaonensis]